MANVAAILKSEIARVARKEVRAKGEAVKKALAQQKFQIAALRKEVTALTKTLATLQKALKSKREDAGEVATQETDGVQRRFSPARLLAHRQKLGMSMAQYASLVGVSSPTLRGWELVKRRPNEAQLELVVQARGAKPAPVKD